MVSKSKYRGGNYVGSGGTSYLKTNEGKQIREWLQRKPKCYRLVLTARELQRLFISQTFKTRKEPKTKQERRQELKRKHFAKFGIDVSQPANCPSCNKIVMPLKWSWRNNNSWKKENLLPPLCLACGRKRTKK